VSRARPIYSALKTDTGRYERVVVDARAIRVADNVCSCGHGTRHRPHGGGLQGCYTRLPGARDEFHGRCSCGMFSPPKDEHERQLAEREQALRIVQAAFPVPFGWAGEIYLRESDGSERKVY
jgi:hypothetical protein